MSSIKSSNFPSIVQKVDVVNYANKSPAILWNNINTGIDGLSSVVDLSTNLGIISFMGNCDNATILTVQFSSDGVNFYDSQYSYTLSGAGDIGFNLACSVNYIRLKSSLDVLTTVIVNYS